MRSVEKNGMHERPYVMANLETSKLDISNTWKIYRT